MPNLYAIRHHQCIIRRSTVRCVFGVPSELTLILLEEEYNGASRFISTSWTRGYLPELNPELLETEHGAVIAEFDPWFSFINVFGVFFSPQLEQSGSIASYFVLRYLDLNEKPCKDAFGSITKFTSRSLFTSFHWWG